MEASPLAADFRRRLEEALRGAASTVLSDGRATLTKTASAGVPVLELTPANPAACPLEAALDLPTLTIGRGEERWSTKILNERPERPERLALLVDAVVNGRVEWGWRIRRFGIGPLALRIGIEYARFDLDGEPLEFSRMQARPASGAVHHAYEPY